MLLYDSTKCRYGTSTVGGFNRFPKKLLDLLVKLDQFPNVDAIIKRYVKVATRLKLNTKK